MTVITVPCTILREQVERAASVVPTAGFQPVLKNLLIDVKPGLLRISATDLDLSVITSSPLVTADEEARFIIPAQRLREILKELPEGEVRITVTEPAEGITVIHLEAGGAQWSLQVPEGNFPALPSVDEAEFSDFPRAPFLAAIRAVRFAASKDGSNLGLACVGIARQGDGSAKVTASDGSRVQQARMAFFPLSVQIPAIGSPAAVDEVTRLLARNEDLETAQVALTPSALLFRAGSGVFAARKLNVPGANVEQQILKPAMENKHELIVPRAGLLEAVRRVAITADAHTSAICLSLTPGKLTVVSRDRQGNTAEQSLDISWGASERQVVVNHRHLSEAVSAGSGASCILRLAGSSSKRSAVLIRDDESGIIGVVGQLPGKLLGY